MRAPVEDHAGFIGLDKGIERAVLQLRFQARADAMQWRTQIVRRSPNGIDPFANVNNGITNADVRGLALDASGFGMGQRSQRYAMILRDGKVEKLLVEPGPGLNASSADSVLAHL